MSENVGAECLNIQEIRICVYVTGNDVHDPKGHSRSKVKNRRNGVPVPSKLSIGVYVTPEG
jgi:hypothetical protein